MELRLVRRAAVLATAAFMVSATAVFADTIPADGDSFLPGNQANIDLGTRGPGETVTHSVSFSLVCGNGSTMNHADLGQTVTIQAQTLQKPLDGALATTSTTIGPIPASWPDDGVACPSPLPVLAANGPVTVTVTTPTTPGIDYQFVVIYARLGANGLTGSTNITFTVDVAANTPPSLSLPAPMTAEATSAAGAAVAYVAGASDVEDATDPTPTCNPASGFVFPIGTTTVTCSATDSGALTTTGTFTVTVNDTIAPTLSLPDAIAAEATSAAGATVAYPASATDLVDPAPVVVCAPTSGSTFQLGTTNVICTATDATGNQSTGSFDVTVTDTAAPGLLVPGSIAAEATGADGATVPYDIVVADVVDPAPVVVCAPASGSMFPLGTTTVTCSATDASGNQSTASFQVVVSDSTGPSIVDVPADIAVEAPNDGGAAVTYASPSATDAVGGPISVTCSPPSGGTFAVGTTTVTCSASDASGNTSSATFQVTVTLDAPTTTYNIEWGEPISGGSLSANQSRTIPLKFRLFVDGVELKTGTAVLSIASCGGGAPSLTLPVSFNGGRWSGHLDSSQLNPGCYVATAMIDGVAAGSFNLDLRGAEPVSSPKPKGDKPKK